HCPPVAGKTSTVASSQLMEQVWVSLVPGSVKVDTRLTGVPIWNRSPVVGEVMVRVGATLATVSTALSLTGGLSPSSAVSVTVKTPLSVQVMVVSTALGSANVHGAPALTVQVVVTGSVPFSSAWVTVPSSATVDPSLVVRSGPADTTGGSLTSKWTRAV